MFPSESYGHDNLNNKPSTKVFPAPKDMIKDVKTGADLTSVPLQQLEQGKHTFVLCLDPEDSDASLKALDYTRNRLAVEGDVVVITSVLPLLSDTAPNPYAYGIYSGLIPQEFFDQERVHKHNEYMRKRSLHHLETFAKDFKEGVTLRLHLAFGDPVPKLVEVADHHNADVLVVGRRKLGRFKRFFSAGGISSCLLTNTERSVLVIR
ncbi:hypothetical protein T439DRAFT_327759 [Meredithblackwellia eburnea MCA 4105]